MDAECLVHAQSFSEGTNVKIQFLRRKAQDQVPGV